MPQDNAGNQMTQQSIQPTSLSHYFNFHFDVTLHQLKFLGHILHMRNNEPANIYALYLPPHGKRPRGGQMMSFVKSILKKIDPTDVLTAQRWMEKTCSRLLCSQMMMMMIIIIILKNNEIKFLSWKESFYLTLIMEVYRTNVFYVKLKSLALITP